VVWYDDEGNAEMILIEDDEGGHWTYWQDKETGKWYKHYKSRDQVSGPTQEVTDQNEIDMLNELKEKVEKAWEEHNEEDQGDKSPDDQGSGSGEESDAVLNGPSKPI
jgi:hypothetical protein